MTIDDIPIFCINLNKRSDRWISVNKEFTKHQLDVKRWSAIDASELSIRPLLASSLSHLSLLQYCMFLQYNHVLVFEDDIILSSNFKEKINQYIIELPQDYECFSLHCYKANVSRISEHLCKLSSMMFGSHGLLLTKYAIHKIMQNRSLYCPEDTYLQSLDHVYSPLPEYTLAFQNGIDSDIPETSVLTEYLTFYEQYKN